MKQITIEKKCFGVASKIVMKKLSSVLGKN